MRGCTSLKQQSAPEIEIDVFDWNPVEFRYFFSVHLSSVWREVRGAVGSLRQARQLSL